MLLTIEKRLSQVAPFLLRQLGRHPEWRDSLGADLSGPRTRNEVALAVNDALSASTDPVRVLRERKYFELARITLRDTDPEQVPLEASGMILAELSQLADVLLERALRQAAAQTQQRFGAARWARADGSPVDLGFCVLGLGKLGSEELNYSSDVDLIYIYQAPHAGLRLVKGGATLLPDEYFTRLAQVFGRLVTDLTDDGFLYRIDLDLRPEGRQGTLVVHDEALFDYYTERAATWEVASFMKARPVAGDLAMGYRAIKAISPALYRTTMDYAAVEEIHGLQCKIESAHGKRDDGFHVKVDSGGIRDVEFIVQAIQLLHGGRIPQIRTRGTQDGLRAIGEVGLLPADTVTALLEAYRFLRRVENRLQMREEQQTHLLPHAADPRTQIATSMGLSLTEFNSQLEAHRRRVSEVFARFFPAAGADRILDLFATHIPRQFALDGSRAMLEDLAAQFATAVDSTSDPERALHNLARFTAGVGQRRYYYELLLDRPELVPRLTALFADSNYLSAILASHPRLIEPVFDDPNVLVVNRKGLDEDLSSLVSQLEHALAESGREPSEVQLEALRLLCHRQRTNIGLLDLGGRIDHDQAERGLSDVAEACLARALTFAGTWLEARRGPPPRGSRFAIVAMGKLASREISYGSDLDLVFVFDAGHTADGEVEAQDWFTRLAQRVLSLLQTHTTEGFCYEIDARLRPSGNQGPLVTSFDSFRAYHASHAQLWERQALLRARPVAGDPSLGNEYEGLRRDILARGVSRDAIDEIRRIRSRMEKELARESPGRHDFKTGRGGMLDVENVVQLMQLRHVLDAPALLDPDRTEIQIDRLRRLGVLSEADAIALRDGWGFLQRLSSRLRVVENRAISDLDEEQGDLDGLARRLGYTETVTSPRRALLMDYRKHTDAIRVVFDRLIQLDGA